ncbi:LolA-like protein [Streptomyces sparsus]
MRRRRGTTAALLALALTNTGLTGCSGRDAAAGEGQPSDPVADVRRVADVLVRNGSSRARTAMHMASGGTVLTIRSEGDFDYRRRIGRLKVTLPDRDRRPVTEVIVPGALYMKNRGAGVPADKWVRVDTTALSDGNLVTHGVTDPISAAELLRGAAGVTYVGRSQIDGETVHRYRGTSDLVAAAEAASEGSRQQLAAAAEGFSTKTVPFDVFLDGQGRLRKVRHAFVFSNGAGEGVQVNSVTALHGFGTAVDVEAPEQGDIYTGTIAEPDE